MPSSGRRRAACHLATLLPGRYQSIQSAVGNADERIGATIDLALSDESVSEVVDKWLQGVQEAKEKSDELANDFAANMRETMGEELAKLPEESRKAFEELTTISAAADT